MAEYDTLQIKIEADSKQANTSIKNLSTNLRNLNEEAKAVDTKRLVEVRGLLQSIAKIDFSNVIKGLQSVVSAFKAFNSKAYQKAVGGKASSGSELNGNLPRETASAYEPNFKMVGTSYSKDTKALATLNDEFKKYSKNLNEAFGKTAGLNKQIDVIELLRQALSELNVDEEKVKEIVRATRAEMKTFSSVELVNVVKALKSFGWSSEEIDRVLAHLKVNVKNLKQDFNLLANSIEYTSKGQDKIKQVKFDNPTSYVDTLKQIKIITPEMVEAQNRYNNTLKALREAGLNVSQTETALKALSQETKKISSKEIRQVQKVLTALGYDSKKIRQVTNELNKLDAGAKKGANAFKKLANQFKNIMKYRIIRKIIQEIYKALTEGIANVVAFDKATSDTVNELKSKFEFVKNSLGAMLAPLIQMVAPILNMIMTLVGELGNTFAEIFAGANGQTEFAKATDDLRDFNEEAKKTQSLGIDELNVLQQDSPSGFTMEQVQLGEKTEGIASAIANIMETIRGIVERIKPIIQDLTSKLLPAIGSILTPIMDIVKVIVDLVMTLVGQTFGEVNSSLASFGEALGSILECVSSIINGVNIILMPVMHILSALLNSINSVLGGAFKFISDIFRILKPILDIVNVLLIPLSALLTVVSTIFYVIQGIVQTIVKVVTFDWAHIGDTWAEVGNNIKKAWEDMGKVASDAVNGVGAYATGGFPEDGFFFANHNELVGQFSNGRTAVANNEQITEGIYQAVLQAMRESGGSQDVVINLDGQQLAKVVTKRQNNFGADVVVGGNIKWGV